MVSGHAWREGSALVAGGTGALGLLVAQWLAYCTSTKELVLLGRTGRIAGQQVLDKLMSGQVRIERCDVSIAAEAAHSCNGRQAPWHTLLQAGALLVP